MSHTYDQPPRHANALRARIRNIARAQDLLEDRLTYTVSMTVIAQMLRGGVVKGGTAISLRGGQHTTRFSKDIDAIRPAGGDVNAYVDELRDQLGEGWNGFTATIRPGRQAKPVGIPEEDLMAPFRVALSYCGGSIMTVDLELVTDEVGSVTAVVEALAPEIAELFADLGFPQPRPVPVLASEYQIVQKLHACTTPDDKGGNDRSHDLVDIQALCRLEAPDRAELDRIGRIVFAARGAGPWPPTVAAFAGWADKYPYEAEGTGVLSLEDAIVWANKLIDAAVAAGQR